MIGHAPATAFDLDIPDAGALAILPREPLPAIPSTIAMPDGQIADASTSLADSLVRHSRAKKPKPFACPFTVAIDHRERAAAYPFTGLDAGHHHSNRPLVVEKVTKHLATGDYSIVGCEELVCVERKQLSDFFSTLAGKDENGEPRLERFRREHERMARIIRRGGRACVVVESEWSEVYRLRGHYTRMTWASIRGVYEEWQVKYGVPWRMEGGRRLGERATWEFLWRWWGAKERERERTEEAARETAEMQGRIEEACKGL